MKSEHLTVLGSLALAVAFGLIISSVVSRIYFPLGSPYLYVPISVSVFMIPIGFNRRIINARLEDAERRVSDFLRDLSEYTMFGVPLSEAVTRVSRNNYGALNGDVRRLASSVSTGTPVEDALDHFGKVLNDPELQRIGIILRKAGESGSNTSDVIALVAQFTSQMQLLREERESEMKNYNLILMISFAVFLFVMVVIDVRFFAEIKLAHTQGLNFQSAGASVLKRIFDIGIYVEAVGIGTIIGLVNDRNPVSGFVETGMMLLASSIVLAFAGAI